MTINTRRWSLGLVAFTAVAFAGCGGSGSGADPSSQTGFLSLGVSDGPIHSALHVCIEFDEIEFKQAGAGDTIVLPLDPPEKVDLLQFQGANAFPIVTNAEMPAGDYEWMRLGVNAVRGANGGLGHSDTGVCDGEASYIVMDDGLWYNLYVPSGNPDNPTADKNRLKLVSGYTVPTNDQVNLTLEFDLAKSITAPPGQSPDVMLRPTIRLVNNNEVGTLTGEVDPSFVEPEGCEPSVFVFNQGVVPNGIGDEEIEEGAEQPEDPIATAMVEAQEQPDGSTQYHYTVGFLLTGTYNAAFTCDGATFEPAEGKEFTIENPGDVEHVDFFPPEEVTE